MWNSARVPKGSARRGSGPYGRSAETGRGDRFGEEREQPRLPECAPGGEKRPPRGLPQRKRKQPQQGPQTPSPIHVGSGRNEPDASFARSKSFAQAREDVAASR